MEKSYSNPKLFRKILKEFKQNRGKIIKELISHPLEKLIELKKYYFDWAKGAEEMGATESAIVNGEKWQMIEEAIKVKENEMKDEMKIVEGK